MSTLVCCELKVDALVLFVGLGEVDSPDDTVVGVLLEFAGVLVKQIAHSLAAKVVRHPNGLGHGVAEAEELHSLHGVVDDCG